MNFTFFKINSFTFKAYTWVVKYGQILITKQYFFLNRSEIVTVVTDGFNNPSLIFFNFYDMIDFMGYVLRCKTQCASFLCACRKLNSGCF